MKNRNILIVYLTLNFSQGVPVRKTGDTYAYFVKVETYVDEKPITKKGTFVLIR